MNLQQIIAMIQNQGSGMAGGLPTNNGSNPFGQLNGAEEALSGDALAGAIMGGNSGDTPFGQLGISEEELINMKQNSQNGDTPFGQLSFSEMIKSLGGGTPGGDGTPFSQIRLSEEQLKENNINQMLNRGTTKGMSREAYDRIVKGHELYNEAYR